MSVLSAGLQIVGGVIQAQGAMQQAEAEAKAHEYNAAVAARNKKVIKQQTKAAKQDFKLNSIRERASIRAKYAANGVPMTGSALDVMLDVSKTQALDQRRIGYKGKLLQLEQEDDRNLSLMSASNARKAGSISAAAAILGGVSGAASTLTRVM